MYSVGYNLPITGLKKFIYVVVSRYLNSEMCVLSWYKEVQNSVCSLQQGLFVFFSASGISGFMYFLSKKWGE